MEYYKMIGDELCVKYHGKWITFESLMEYAISGKRPEVYYKRDETTVRKQEENHMKIIVKDRGTGKTTQLIYVSEATGYPIVACAGSNVDYIKNLANYYGCKIPEPITANRLLDESVRGNPQYDNILLDNMECILADALRNYFGGRNIICATTSIGKKN